MSFEQRFTKSVVGKVVKTERKNNSVNGNPRFMITLDNGNTYLTPTDAAMNYGIENPEYRDTAHRYGLTPGGSLNGYTEVAE